VGVLLPKGGAHRMRLWLSQVYSILDEYILAGEVSETSKVEILGRIRELEKREKE